MATIILIGFMGAGKTTVGSLLAKQMGCPFIDMDQQLEQELGQTVADYFEKYGESCFRKQEQELLRKVIAATAVIATGGGVVTDVTNRQLLRKQKCVVFLKSQPETFLQRIQEDDATIRPLVQTATNQEIIALYKKRKDAYEECSQLTVKTDGKQPEEICQMIRKWVQ